MILQNIAGVACKVLIFLGALFGVVHILYCLFRRSSGAGSAERYSGFLSSYKLLTCFSILFVFVDYLIGNYETIYAAMRALRENLFLFCATRLGIMALSGIALLLALIFKRGSVADTFVSLKGTLKSGALFGLLGIVLRWLLTGF